MKAHAETLKGDIHMFFLPDALSILTATHNWVAWRLENVQGRDKPAKIPYNPNTGERAKPNDNSTWSSFDNAKALADKFHGGLGFMFSDGCGYCGIDLDNVILSDGTLKPFAQDIVDALDSYTEISPSGNGLHILCTLKRPLSTFGSKRNNRALGAEIYDSAHYLTVTGNVYGDEKPIRDCTNILSEIYQKYWHSELNDNKVQVNSNASLPPDNLSDSELLERMFNSQHGLEIKRLYEGDITGYQSQSEAELALCNHLAFWTGHNASRIDSLFRRSGLMRPKWDEKHGNQTYGQMTIDKAINSASTRNVSTSKDKSPSQNQNSRTGRLEWVCDPKPYREWLQAHGHEHKTPASDNQNQQQPNEGTPQQDSYQSAQSENETIHIATFDEYVLNSFQSDVQNFKAFSEATTGFKNLDDDNVRLYPGLYAIGGVSSVGKTTFCSQLADNIAQRGGYVIFFSLEQSRFELASKGIARRVAQMTNSHYVTSLQIRNGFTDAYVKKAIDEYMNIAAHEVIVEGQYNISVSDIAHIVEQFVANTGERTTVFVDYLQVLNPDSAVNSTKDAIDFNVQALKRLSTQFNIPVFCISSFNRTNYLNIADFESFNGSGGIEFTADVVIALQFLAMNANVFDTQSKLQTKRKFVRKAKRENPRKIELLRLKNRFGESSSRYFFDYFAANELFVPYLVSDEEADDKVQAEFDAFDSQQENDAVNSKKSSKKDKRR